MRAINEVMLRLSKRAEQYDQEHLMASFVDAGALLTLLGNRDNQVIFGRRGTGKTHVLAYLAQELKIKRDVVVEIDMRSIGSSGGIYGDSSRPLAERATRLLIDTLQEIHSRLVAAVLSDETVDLRAVQRPLDNFADSTVDVRVEGRVTVEENQRQLNKDTTGGGFDIDVEGRAHRYQVPWRASANVGQRNRLQVSSDSASCLDRLGEIWANSSKS